MTDDRYHIRFRTTKLNDLYKKEPAIDNMALNKIFIGKVRDTRDPQLMGRILVWIPELTGNSDDPDNWYVASYCSPFAGSSFLDIGLYTDNDERSDAVAHQRNILNGERTPENNNDLPGGRQSYGMWFSPPDIGNEVVVTFARGDSTSCIWMGCLFGQFLNHMVPGIASAMVTDKSGTSIGDGPAIETDLRSEQNLKIDNPPRIKFSPLFDGLVRQGLESDNRRGPSTSTARRESPSQVFGILTPNGSQFVMDDGTDNIPEDTDHPGGDEFIRLRTKSGTQLLLNESDGSIYAITKDGKTWIELGNDGNIDIYGKSNISIHAETGNINLRTSGNEGDINIQSSRDLNIDVKRDIRLSVGGETHLFSVGDIKLATEASYNLTTINNIAMASNEGQIGITALSDINIQSAQGKFSVFSSGDLALNSTAEIGITTTGDIREEAENVFMNSGPGPQAPAPGPAPTVANGPIIRDGVPGPTMADTDDGPWTVGDPYESNTNIVPRVPQHEPWPARATKDASATNGIIAETETDARLGANSVDATVPNDIIEPDGTVKRGVGYDNTGNPLYFIDSLTSSSSLTAAPPTLSTSSVCKETIRNFENPSSTITTNVAGQQVIGFGHVVTDKEQQAGTYTDQTLSQSEMETLFNSDILVSEGTVQRAIQTNLTQGQFDSLVSYGMNVGPQEFENGVVVNRINSNKLSEIPTLFTKFSSVRDIVGNLNKIQGLANRRNFEAQLFAQIPGQSIAQKAQTQLGNFPTL